MPNRKKKTLKLWVETFTINGDEEYNVLKTSDIRNPTIRVFYKHREDLEGIITQINSGFLTYEEVIEEYNKWTGNSRGFHPIHRPTATYSGITPPWKEILK